MDTATAIKANFKELLGKDAYGKITVDDICRAAFVSKKTFYKYFDGKLAIVDAVYRDDFVLPTEKIREHLPVDRIKSMPLLMLEQHYEKLYEQQNIYRNVLESCGRDAYVDLHIRNTVESNAEIYACWGVSEDELDYIAYYITATGAMLDARWLEQGCEEPPIKMARLFKKWVLCRFDHPET